VCLWQQADNVAYCQRMSTDEIPWWASGASLRKRRFNHMAAQAQHTLEEGDRKVIQLVKASASKLLGMALDVSMWGIALSTLWATCPQRRRWRSKPLAECFVTGHWSYSCWLMDLRTTIFSLSCEDTQLGMTGD